MNRCISHINITTNCSVDETVTKGRISKIGMGEKRKFYTLFFFPNIKLLKTTSFAEDPLV